MVIPARGGSKRLLRKNVLPLHGKPLICWTIEAALKSQIPSKIIVSSEDSEILTVADRYADEGVVLHHRPAELATDTTTTTEVISNICNSLLIPRAIAQTMVLLQPTSPLRAPEDISSALKLYKAGNTLDTIVSVTENEHPTAWSGTLNKHNVLTGIDFSGNQSQNLEREYRLNGAIYIFDVHNFKLNHSIFTQRVRGYVMPLERSVDIDTKFDFTLAELLLLKQMEEKRGNFPRSPK